jgi:GNAT superfamily N-acetyltransferase
MDTSVRFRDARPGDEAIVSGFVRSLAEYENLLHEAVATEADFSRALFGSPPRAHALIIEDSSGPIGVAVWFYNFSTFTCRPGLYVEDVFVMPERRGQGIGRAVFRELARRAIAEGCERMEWWVLNWNASAIAFYRSLGAQAMDEWTTQRLTGAALAAVAA